MSSVVQLPGDFIPAADDVLADGMGRQWVPSGWPVLLRDDEAGVERLADALHPIFWDESMEHATDGDRACGDMERPEARAIIEALREG